jgi:hypothetical protein
MGTAEQKRMKTGLVSLTCDAWQASNADAYFAVTGHWNEEVSPNNWEHQSALFGFTQMNTAHNGVHLGRALYKIVKRVGVEKKVCTLFMYDIQACTYRGLMY